MRRRQWAAAAVGLVATAGFAYAGQVATDTWRIGRDLSVETCLPYHVYLIKLGMPNPMKGDIVSFHTKGLAPHHVDGTVFTKLVMGVPGDLVEVSADGVRINDWFQPFVQEGLKKYGVKRSSTYRLQADEYFMGGTNPRSYDSRYYGPVKSYQLAGEAKPLW